MEIEHQAATDRDGDGRTIGIISKTGAAAPGTASMEIVHEDPKEKTRPVVECDDISSFSFTAKSTESVERVHEIEG